MRRPALALTSLVAWVGVVVGHLTAYALTVPSAARHQHLEATGHGWMDAAAVSVLAIVPVVLIATAVRSLRSGAALTGARLFFRLLAVQLPAFALIEIAERGWSLERAASDTAVLAGLALQPLVSILATLGLRLVHRAVRAVVSRLRPSRRIATVAFPRPVTDRHPHRSWLFLPAGRRAPPAALAP